MSRRPLRAILLLVIIILLVSLVLYWLGWSVTSGLILLVFLFSIRDIVFASSFRLSELGLTISHPLMGAKSLDWPILRQVEVREGRLWVVPAHGRSYRLPLPEPMDLAELSVWLSWFQEQRSEESPR